MARFWVSCVIAIGLLEFLKVGGNVRLWKLLTVPKSAGAMLITRLGNLVFRT